MLGELKPYTQSIQTSLLHSEFSALLKVLLQAWLHDVPKHGHADIPFSSGFRGFVDSYSGVFRKEKERGRFIESATGFCCLWFPLSV
jgi:hypothetical protein